MGRRNSIDQRLIIMEGPDGCGKTNIGKALSRYYNIPYFKISTEADNWRNNKFKEALEFDQTWASQFFEQTGISAICDRMYPSEWTYSKVYSRQTNPDVLEHVDEKFARCNCIIIICRRRDYSVVSDDLVKGIDTLELIDYQYGAFIEWTRCSKIEIYVDDFESRSDQLRYLVPKLNEMFYANSTNFAGRKKGA